MTAIQSDENGGQSLPQIKAEFDNALMSSILPSTSHIDEFRVTSTEYESRVLHDGFAANLLVSIAGATSMVLVVFR